MKGFVFAVILFQQALGTVVGDAVADSSTLVQTQLKSVADGENKVSPFESVKGKVSGWINKFSGRAPASTGQVEGSPHQPSNDGIAEAELDASVSSGDRARTYEQDLLRMPEVRNQLLRMGQDDVPLCNAFNVSNCMSGLLIDDKDTVRGDSAATCCQGVFCGTGPTVDDCSQCPEDSCAGDCSIQDGQCASSTCVPPQGVNHSLEPPCIGGAAIGNKLTCWTRCRVGYIPSPFSMLCEDGVFSPAKFECVPDTCMDNVQNNGEQGVDCGGGCMPCQTTDSFKAFPEQEEEVVYEYAVEYDDYDYENTTTTAFVPTTNTTTTITTRTTTTTTHICASVGYSCEFGYKMETDFRPAVEASTPCRQGSCVLQCCAVEWATQRGACKQQCGQGGEGTQVRIEFNQTFSDERVRAICESACDLVSCMAFQTMPITRNSGEDQEIDRVCELHGDNITQADVPVLQYMTKGLTDSKWSSVWTEGAIYGGAFIGGDGTGEDWWCNVRRTDSAPVVCEPYTGIFETYETGTTTSTTTITTQTTTTTTNCPDGSLCNFNWHRPAPCDINNSNHQPGLDCACLADGYTQNPIVWNKSVPQGECLPMPCSVPFSNRKPGPDCACLPGYRGAILWTGEEPYGTCHAALCTIKNGNKKAGPACACAGGFHGNITWEEGEALPKGECIPARCRVPRSNFKDGPDCKCQDGFLGTITWDGPTAYGNCTEAPCDTHGCENTTDDETPETYYHPPSGKMLTGAGVTVSKSNMSGRGSAVRCKDAYKGYVAWHGGNASAECSHVECGTHPGTENSYKVEGKDGCQCADGFVGTLVFKADKVMSGTCGRANCSLPNTTWEPGPGCKCANGFAGTVTWNGTVPTANCTPAPCYLENSDLSPGLDCRCAPGFTGNITWYGSRPNGEPPCVPAKCDIWHSNGVDGPSCACARGYAGNISWDWDVPTGDCSPADCLVDNTVEDGLNCTCANGYTGMINWVGDVASGECVPAACDVKNTNRLAGLECDCGLGYNGTISWNGSTPYGTCTGVPCPIENSNGLIGTACACKSGYSGSIVWEGPNAVGTCTPASCAVHNSNKVPGEGCKCRDGFAGEITWNGVVTSGECHPAPCEVPNSNFEDGLRCRCLDSFPGVITWNGSVATGSCTILPCLEIADQTLCEDASDCAWNEDTGVCVDVVPEAGSEGSNLAASPLASLTPSQQAVLNAAKD